MPRPMLTWTSGLCGAWPGRASHFLQKQPRANAWVVARKKMRRPPFRATPASFALPCRAQHVCFHCEHVRSSAKLISLKFETA